MKHTPVISIFIMIVGFIGAISISASKMTPLREAMYPANAQLERVYLPVLGIDKFYADIQWINLIQDMGQAMLKEGSKPEEDNADEKAKKAQYFYRQLDRLTDLSPNTDLFYTQGAMYISHDLPEKAIALLEKGDKYSTVHNWRRAHYCAFIQDKVISAREESDSAKEQMLPKIITYLEKALENNDAPSYVEREWLRKQAAQQRIENDEIGQLMLWFKHFQKKTMVDGAQSGVEMPESVSYSSEIDQSNQTLRSDIMKKAQKIALSIWNSRKTADKAASDDLDKKLEEVKNVFFAIAPEGHYSPVSLVAYEAGERFDVATGTAVEPFGICKACEKRGLTTVLRGEFCHVCGAPTETAATAAPAVAEEEPVAKPAKAGRR